MLAEIENVQNENFGHRVVLERLKSLNCCIDMLNTSILELPLEIDTKYERFVYHSLSS